MALQTASCLPKRKTEVLKKLPSKEASEMRLFVALDIPEAVRENLAGMRRDFPSIGSQLRWVPPQNFHVTLKFIGSVPPEKLPPIIEALHRVSLVDRVQLRIRGVGWLVNAKTGVILFATVEDSKPLTALATAIDHQLERLGFTPENRTFMPHLTLVRASRDLPASLQTALRELAEQHRQYDFGSMTATEFHLTESKTLPSGPVYSKVQSFPFVAAGN
jgi:RNA 2',3'-cyclic 3'-phosphodiesterase